jgi:DNA primase
MLIRKNTKAFKSILEIITACQTRADREKLVRLYITKAGHSVNDRISVEGIEGESGLFYEMNYQTVLNSLTSSQHQLHSSDEIPGIYFFRSTTNKTWDETPFEFDPDIGNEFESLPELPLTRKKEKAKKFSLPAPGVKSETRPEKRLKVNTQREEKPLTPKTAKVLPRQEKVPENKPVRHSYKLRHTIEFTDMDKVFFRQANLNKRHVLDYYYNVSEYLLPWLKERAISVIRFDKLKSLVPLSISSISNNDEESTPSWLNGSKENGHVLFCNDVEHLMYYVDRGCVQFNSGHSKVKRSGSPDYIVIAIESPDHEISRAVDVALAMNEILVALKLQSLVKLGEPSLLHVYIPLDAKDDFDTVSKVAHLICKLVTLKLPKLVAIKGQAEEYGKVIIDPSANNGHAHTVAPYSLVAGQVPVVAVPLSWEELSEDLAPEDFNNEGILKRLKKTGDPFESFFSKKINAGSLLARLDEHYGFLF